MVKRWSRGMEGARRGLLIGCLALCLIVATALVLGLLDFFLFAVLRLPARGAAFSLVTVFGLLPMAMLAAMPWVLVVIKYANMGLTAAVGIAGFLLNFTLFGLVVGFPDPGVAMRAILGTFWRAR